MALCLPNPDLSSPLLKHHCVLFFSPIQLLQESVWFKATLSLGFCSASARNCTCWAYIRTGICLYRQAHCLEQFHKGTESDWSIESGPPRLASSPKPMSHWSGFGQMGRSEMFSGKNDTTFDEGKW